MESSTDDTSHNENTLLDSNYHSDDDNHKRSSKLETPDTSDLDHIPNADQHNGLKTRSWPFMADRVENPFTYGTGGNLPVHIGSMIDRYRVVQKLQHLYRSNTWLCIDTKSEKTKYYSLKIMRADAPKDNPELWIGELFSSIHADPPPQVHLALPYQVLQVDSPNGSHDVIVTPFIGPQIDHLFSLRGHATGEAVIRQMCHQITHALTVLNDCNLCHGDIQPIHVWAQAHGVDGRSEEAVLKDIGEPKIDSVLDHETGKQAEAKYGPMYMVYKVDWDEMEGNTIDMTKKAYLSFFENAFKDGDDPKRMNIALSYCAPEWILNGKGGIPSDMWSLACTLFEIRTGKPLFKKTTHDFDYLLSITLMIGAMPEKWLAKWPNHKKLFQDKPDKNGKVVTKEGLKLPRGLHRSIREAIEKCFDGLDRNNPDGKLSIPRYLKKEEVDLFDDLLKKMLRWDPEKRIKKKDLLSHPWFSYEEANILNEEHHSSKSPKLTSTTSESS